MTDSLDYIKICESCPAGDGWGPSVTSETTLNGVPYAPFSKGDKLGRMADWTAEGKDRERGGRSQYNRNFRGRLRQNTLFRPRKHLFCLVLAGLLADLNLSSRPTSLRCQPRYHFQRTSRRGRVYLLRR